MDLIGSQILDLGSDVVNFGFEGFFFVIREGGKGVWAKKRKVDGNRRGSKLGEGSFTVLLASFLRVRRQNPGEMISPGNFQFPLTFPEDFVFVLYRHKVSNPPHKIISSLHGRPKIKQAKLSGSPSYYLFCLNFMTSV